MVDVAELARRIDTAPASEKERLVAQIDAAMRALGAGPEVPPFPEYLRARMAARGQAPWPYQERMTGELAQHRDLIIGKARQIGVTELLCDYGAWFVEQGKTVLVLAQGELYSTTFVRRTGLRRHPDRLTANNSEVELRNGGHIMALPATEDAGRSLTADLVIADEAGFHPYARENFRAYRPTMADGGQLVIVSTGNGPSGFFYDYWSTAPENGFRKLFYGCFERPGRDDAWYYEEAKRYLASNPAALPGDFTRENCRTEDEMFLAHSGLVYGADPVDGVLIFDPRRNVVQPPFTWDEAKWRIVGFDPGGRDPNAMIPIGVDTQDRVHVYGEFYRRGEPTLETIDDYLQRLEDRGHIHMVVVDPSAKGWVPALKARGWPADEADNDKGARINVMSGWLKSGRLTVSPVASNFIGELTSYWWQERRDGQSGGAAHATTTPAHHHGDACDATGYACLAINQGRLWPEGLTGGVAIEVRDEYPHRGRETLKEHLARKREARR